MDSFSARYCSDPQSRRRWLVYGSGAAMVIVLIIIIVAVAVDREINYLPDDDTIPGSDVLHRVPLIDAFNNVPSRIDEFNVEKLNFANASFQTNIENLKNGKVAAVFFVAKAPCHSSYKDAAQITLSQIDVIKRLIEQNSESLTLATTPQEITAAFQNKKIACLIGVNGGHSIDSRLSLLRLYYDLGVRFLTLTQYHCDTPWVDSNFVDDMDNTTRMNLTEWGESVVTEMNRLGMVIDLTDSSQEVIKTVLEKSKKPVIFSHSAAYSIYHNSTNVRDEIKDNLIKNKGLIMVNFSPEVLGKDNVNMPVMIDHLDHLKKTFGIDQIGIGANFDSVPETEIKDFENISKYPHLFDILKDPVIVPEPVPSNQIVREKWTSQDLEKLAGNNFLQLFQNVIAKNNGNKDTIQEIQIPTDYLKNKDPEMECRTVPENNLESTISIDTTTISTVVSEEQEEETTINTTESTDKPNETSDKPVETSDKPVETSDKPDETPAKLSVEKEEVVPDQIQHFVYVNRD